MLGSNTTGQLGQGDTTTASSTPVQVEVSAGVPLTDVTQISLGRGHACAISRGNLFCCGFPNANGQVGNGSNTNQNRPVKILTGGVTWVTAGLYHTCAVQGGGLKCWGRNGNGQLGTGNTSYSSTPVQVVNSDIYKWRRAAFNTLCSQSDRDDLVQRGWFLQRER
jgi:alpha-tubulin suppressor-like RCC1 family protein